MPTPPATWKSIERFVAEYLGGERTHWAREDVRAKGFNIEVKHGKTISKQLLGWWNQAITNAPLDRIPLLVIHPTGWRRHESLAIIQLDELRKLLDK